MPIEAFDKLACPLDGEPLSKHDKNWVCPQGHSYDQARQGYVNLLPVQHKRSKEPGDSKAMVEARQRFLAAGHYQLIAESIARVCYAANADHARLNILDAGCGEGYYLRQLAQRADALAELAVAGLDISKAATLAAARLDKRITWMVGTNAHLPVQDASVDCLLCVFGFPVAAEFARVLKPGGRLIQVDPGPAHLRELRALLYPQLDSEAEPKAPQLEGFHLLEAVQVSYPFQLDSTEQLQDLLAMTPHGHRAPAEGKARVAELTELELTAEVFVRLYEAN